MKNFYKTAIVLIFSFLFLKNGYSQFVTLPDTNFRNALKASFPSCFNPSGQMDTTCSSILNATSLTVYYNTSVSDITGIKYFKKLQTLTCNNDGITFLPELPASLINISAYSNKIASITAPLPPSLQSLDCDYNNNLTSVPTLPSTLTLLTISGNQVTSLPALPSSLQFLGCTGNQISSLPTLPASLTQLYCGNNQISSLPTLPASLVDLSCNNNFLTSLPSLPSTISQFFCDNNQLSSLPILPTALTILSCNNNLINNLPTLPSSLGTLYCYNNKLSSLPALPATLTNLWCNINNLTCLPILPESLTTLYATSNHIKCLPNLPLGLTVAKMDSAYPVCNSINNTNGCPVQVTGTTTSITSADLTLVPNPSKGTVQLTSSQINYADVLVLSAQGKIVFSENAINLSSSIDLSSLPKGLYFVQVSFSQGITTQKLILE